MCYSGGQPFWALATNGFRREDYEQSATWHARMNPFQPGRAELRLPVQSDMGFRVSRRVSYGTLAVWHSQSLLRVALGSRRGFHHDVGVGCVG